MKKYILLGLLLMLSAFAAYSQIEDYANPPKYTIAAIRVEGVEFLDANALINLSGLRVGDEISIPGTAISSAIKKLWKQGILGDVKIKTEKIEGDKVHLLILLKERPRLARFVFKGLKKGEESDIKEQLRLVRGSIITDALLKNTKVSIKKFLAEKGYYNAEVKIIQQKSNTLANRADLRVIVDKNRKVKVKEIIIKGNEALSDKKIKKKMKGTKEKKPFRIFSSSKFIENKFKEDKEKIISYYNSNGYRDAAITFDSVWMSSENRVKIEMHIHEGERYYFRNITWSGNYLYSDEKLSQILGIRKGEIYDKARLEEKLNFSFTEQDITSLYMDDGYLFFRINPVEVAVEGDSIDIEMQIYEGKQATINNVILNGNTRTSDHVVLRELRTRPGEKFSRRDIIRTQQGLSQLGYFDPEKILINPIPNPQNGTVDIEYNVEEKQSDQVELSGGWGGNFGFVGTLGLSFNNFSIRKVGRLRNWKPLPSGDGQKLALRVQANGRAYQRYSVTFTEPWLGGKKPNSFTVNLSHSVQSRLALSEVDGSMKLTSISLSLGRRLKWPDDYFVITNSLQYSVYNLTNFDVGFGFRDGLSTNLNLNTTFSRNSIDSPIFPRVGSSVSLSVSLTPPYSLFDGINTKEEYDALENSEKYRLVEYHKWMFDASFFTPVIGKLVLNTRAHFGYLNTYNKQKELGPFERFILGGDGLSGQNFLLGTEIIGLRGYNNNSIVPISTDSNRGGTVYNKFVMELRYPVSLNPSATIYALAFAEGGNNWNNFDTFSPFDIKRSVGIGARIFMPAFGLIGIDYAYGFDEVRGKDGVNGTQFHFIIGQQLR